jgi:hypothetical protein
MLSSFRLDNIGYDQTRGLNGHIDYLTRFKGGPYYQLLFPPKAFGLKIYSGEGMEDHLEVPSAPEEYQIRVSDADGNTTAVDFRLSGQPSQTVAQAPKTGLLKTFSALHATQVSKPTITPFVTRTMCGIQKN